MQVIKQSELSFSDVLTTSVQPSQQTSSAPAELTPLPSNTSFSLTQPNLQFAWDSTSLSALMTCPRLYQYSILQGYQPRAESVHLVFGIALHSALETYDRERALGLDHDQATCAAVKRAFVDTWKFDLRRPWTSDDPAKNRDSLIRSIVWYLSQFADDPAETIILRNGKPAVELSFRFDLDIESGLTSEQYLLCGHLDRFVEFEKKIWVLDRKTTKYGLDDSYFDKYSPDNQMTIYYIAGQLIYEDRPIAGLIIDGLQIGASFTRFRRGLVYRTKSQIEEYLTDLRHYLALAELYAKQNYWPQNTKSCQQYGGCPFRKVCGASPEVRQPLLNGLFHRRIWDPLISREI